MIISFSFPAAVSLANRLKLKAFIQEIFRREKKKLGGLSYIFCSDNFLLRINQDFLHHDYFTDIISFDFSEPDSPEIHGEIYISVDTVRVNAKTYSTTMVRELHRVIFHGALHLCGYRDKSPRDQKLMRAKEDYYLGLYFDFPRGTFKYQ